MDTSRPITTADLVTQGREGALKRGVRSGALIRVPSRSRADVIRHSGPLLPEDVTEREGLLVTSLPRTIVDVIRTVSTEAAIAYFDAALRLVAWRGHGQYDGAAAERFRAEIDARLEAMPGARGVRQARVVASFADGRAQLPCGNRMEPGAVGE